MTFTISARSISGLASPSITPIAFVRRVVNNMRQQRPRIKVHPVGDGADITKAKCDRRLDRHIENFSQAAIAYDTGR